MPADRVARMHPPLLDHLAWLEGNVCLMKRRANDRRKRRPEKKLHLPVRPKRRLVLCRKPTLCQFQGLRLLRRQIVLLRLFRSALQNDRRHLACHRYLRRRRTVRRHGKQTSEYREAGRHNCFYAVPHGLAISSDQLISFTKKPTGLRMMSSSLVGGLSAVVATAL